MAISDRAQQTTDRLQKFMDKNIYPNNDTYIKQIDDKFASFVQAKVFSIAMDKSKPMAFLNSLLDPDNPKTTGNETLDKLLKSPMFDLDRLLICSTLTNCA